VCDSGSVKRLAGLLWKGVHAHSDYHDGVLGDGSPYFSHDGLLVSGNFLPDGRVNAGFV